MPWVPVEVRWQHQEHLPRPISVAKNCNILMAKVLGGVPQITLIEEQ